VIFVIQIDQRVSPRDLLPGIDDLWRRSAECLRSLRAAWRSEDGSPVFTVNGRYTARGWTEWTQGFQFGSELLQFDATDEAEFLEAGRRATVERMAPHVSHIGVHDHGFNNVSTYGALLRLMREGRIPYVPTERDFYELALKTSGAVQAARWATTDDGGGYIYSFNGPQSLFCDTIRSLRSLALAYRLGHPLMGENDRAISLLGRLLDHARTTARYNVFYGAGRDHYDVRGRVAHESLFNRNDGRYRCPSTQQGYSPFSTWTRGLAWVMLGYPEQLEFIATLSDAELEPYGGRDAINSLLVDAARAACDYFIESTPTDGIPYWDTGAPGLANLPDHRDRPADPCNVFEPVDSSAAAIGAQGLLRLGRYLERQGQSDTGRRYWQAGLTTFRTLLSEPYLSSDPHHQGLLLHAVYHRPNGWDHLPAGQSVPNGESCQWGDYHLREAALYLQRIAQGQPDYNFFGPPMRSTEGTAGQDQECSTR
jgi:unsaturated chondroitin disaccharide hydrolase